MFSVCMIVKNEEKFIKKCISSVLMFTDDIVVVDTGSTDRTKEIASELNVKLFDFIWIEDFSAARNFAASHARYDWVLVIDADEELVEIDVDAIKQFMQCIKNTGMVSLFEVCETPYLNQVIRFYNRKNCMYVNRIHEQLKLIDRTYSSPESKKIPIMFNHYGYSKEIVQSQNKIERNEKMLLEEIKLYPNDPMLYYYLGKTYSAWSKDFHKASAAYEKALVLSPNLGLTYTQNLIIEYGYSLINSGRYADALTLKKHMEALENNPYYRFMMAQVLQNNAQFIEAVDLFESCIGDPTPDFMGVTSYLSYYNIGVIFECVGMNDEAREYYQNCGDFEPAKKRLSII